MDRDQRPFLQSLILSIALMLACTGVLVVIAVAGVDTACVNTANDWIRVYPGGELVEREYNLIRPYGIGVTETIIDVPAPPLWAALWHTFNLGIAPERIGLLDLLTVSWYLEPTDDGGTRITIQTRCAQG